MDFTTFAAHVFMVSTWMRAIESQPAQSGDEISAGDGPETGHSGRAKRRRKFYAFNRRERIAAT